MLYEISHTKWKHLSYNFWSSIAKFSISPKMVVERYHYVTYIHILLQVKINFVTGATYSHKLNYGVTLPTLYMYLCIFIIKNSKFQLMWISKKYFFIQYHESYWNFFWFYSKNKSTILTSIIIEEICNRTVFFPFSIN